MRVAQSRISPRWSARAKKYTCARVELRVWTTKTTHSVVSPYRPRAAWALHHLHDHCRSSALFCTCARLCENILKTLKVAVQVRTAVSLFLNNFCTQEFVYSPLRSPGGVKIRNQNKLTKINLAYRAPRTFWRISPFRNSPNETLVSGLGTIITNMCCLTVNWPIFRPNGWSKISKLSNDMWCTWLSWAPRTPHRL